jgi:hypothetical protein
VFWEVDLIDAPDYQSELQRPSNWHDHGISAISCQRKQCFIRPGEGWFSRYKVSAGLTALLEAPEKQRTEFLRAAAQTDTDTGRNYFRKLWTKDHDYYANSTRTATVINYDAPGFSMTPHCDNNHIMLQLIVNLTDNDSGTELLDITSPESYYTMTGQRNKGIMFLNGAGTLHSIRNINKDRYTLYSAIMIG